MTIALPDSPPKDGPGTLKESSFRYLILPKTDRGLSLMLRVDGMDTADVLNKKQPLFVSFYQGNHKDVLPPMKTVYAIMSHPPGSGPTLETPPVTLLGAEDDDGLTFARVAGRILEQPCLLNYEVPPGILYDDEKLQIWKQAVDFLNASIRPVESESL